MSDPDAKPCGCFTWVECRCADEVYAEVHRLTSALREAEARAEGAERERDDEHRNCADINDVLRLTAERDAALRERDQYKRLMFESDERAERRLILLREAEEKLNKAD